jgi:adenylate cyclase
MDDPSMLNLGGERKELTAFFSDIQGFSTISESMEADELVHFLNEYLTEMCDIILKYDGTIDKFEGDAIIAFFGAPIYFEDHAVRACLCAVDIQERMKELRKKWTEEGRHEIHMRIGLNTGDMVVGNMGSADRMDYTMMGDSVNLAARLEEAGKQYRIYTMISEFTYEEAKEHIEVRELDITRVVGKEKPVKVYEILGRKGQVSPEKMKVVELFQEGLELYKNRYWMDAVVKFMAAIELDPHDGPSHVFMARCEEYNENPPSAGWDGVYTMTKK